MRCVPGYVSLATVAIAAAADLGECALRDQAGAQRRGHPTGESLVGDADQSGGTCMGEAPPCSRRPHSYRSSAGSRSSRSHPGGSARTRRSARRGNRRRSPTCQVCTSLPTASMTPTISCPGSSGDLGLARSLPEPRRRFVRTIGAGSDRRCPNPAAYTTDAVTCEPSMDWR